MKKDLPIFDIVLNDEDLSQGVGRISLVDEPAIGVDWIQLRAQDAIDIEFSMTLTDRGLCFGCPPNGDGTRVNGEPDRRCKKGDGSGEIGGAGKTGGTGKSSSKEPNLSSKIKNSEKKVDLTADESNKVLEAMRGVKETKEWSKNGRTVTIKRDYQIENWVSQGGGTSIGFLVSGHSYTATNGVPDNISSGKYYDGTEVGTVTRRADGTRTYNFDSPEEKKKFFDRLGL